MKRMKKAEIFEPKNVEERRLIKEKAYDWTQVIFKYLNCYIPQLEIKK
jgi:hypothetical protein